MLAVVKKPHIEIRADLIPQPVIAFFKALYGEVEVIAEQPKRTSKSVAWDDTALAQTLREEVSPAENLATMRQTFSWTLALLSQKTGIPAQNLSAMEKGRRTISKETAERLAEAFGTGPELFYFYAPISKVASPKVQYRATSSVQDRTNKSPRKKK